MIHKLKNKIKLPAPLFKLMNGSKPQFECPLCHYHGPFRDFNNFGGLRRHVECPRCGTLERHRVQYLVVSEILNGLDTKKMKMLHFAPEPFFREFFISRFGQYETADLCMKGVDYHVDLQKLPFADATYDFIFASHVLEHVPDDKKGIQEIRRILKPGGWAILPVPVICEHTVEYPEANPHEAYHMRAPGLDYHKKFIPYFAKVETRTSESLPEKYQPFIYEDRSHWPTEKAPRRPAMSGERHIDVVPICRA
ncbi:MAG TPA: methyltransferase domain-containing protein [Verrucomicrobiae bacterium]|nr:methyltransferase domain-containing protein [Verrucomicrobiae bacterium]